MVIPDTGVHGVGMQINATVKLMLLGIAYHRGMLRGRPQSLSRVCSRLPTASAAHTVGKELEGTTMPHIHDKIDFTVAIFVVQQAQVLLVHHRALDKWLPLGGHIELDE